MRRFFLHLTFLLASYLVTAQNVTVQALDFNSTTRDTVIDFPEGDHNKYEKILMHYGMRCKDALVSTGAQRNLGCGEWDYSCNTYIVDSTRVDSLKQVAGDHVIEGFSGDEFFYTDSQTYTYFQRTERQTLVESGQQNWIPITEGTENLEVPFGKAASQLSLSYILQADELTDSGLIPGNISGLYFPILNGLIELEGLKIELQNVDVVEVSGNELPNDWVEVYHLTSSLSASTSHLIFDKFFEWDGISNLAFRISYGTVTGTDTDLSGMNVNRTALKFTQPAYENYTDFGSSGYIHMDQPLNQITDEITISYWQYGGPELPVNSSVVEASNSSNQRSINIHQPWSNGQVYWDCGAEGGSYDRINKQANPEDYKGQWNHWAFTKNATTGEMLIFLNGALWHSGEDKFRTIDLQAMNIGASIINTASRSFAKMSDFRLWSKALDEETIQQWMRKELTSDHPSYDDLVLHYPLSQVDNGQMIDLTGTANATVEGQVALRRWRIGEAVMSESFSSIVPEITLDQGTYVTTVTEIPVIDSIPNLPNRVDYYVLDGTDRLLDRTEFLFEAGSFPITDESGQQVGERIIPAIGTIEIGEINYYSKNPMAYEIMSFVTPYGINLDFGEEGESWTFDVTDFGPILKGKKRLYMSRGGQWQEEMDIWFEFIEGTPARDVIDISQVWPVTSVPFARINDDWRFEPRLLYNDPNAAEFMLKTTITGHGQQGEFIPREHFTAIGTPEVGVFTDSWRAWTECADNPVYPQGGTWVYDRAGWCPGAASDVREFRLTDFVKFFDTLAVLDYDVEVASGDSRYIVSSQLVSYGEINKDLDLAVEDIRYPSQKIEHRRYNPTCQAPVIVLKNYGDSDITEAVIEYGIIGQVTKTYSFQGSINFLESEEVELPFLNELSLIADGDVFFASVISVNGQEDTYANNDTYMTDLQQVDNYETDIVIEFNTNLTQETFYQLLDSDGNSVFGRVTGLQPNRTYRDTIKGLNGCYTILIEDTDDDGLAWWANGDGTGYFLIRNAGGSSLVIEPDFGKFSQYNFTAGSISSVSEIKNERGYQLYPNPSSDKVYFTDLDGWDDHLYMTIGDDLGRKVFSANTTKYDLSDGHRALSQLDSGIYYVTIYDRKGSATVKFIKL